MFVADGLNVSVPVKSQMNVTVFPFPVSFSLLAPRSVTTHLLQVADEFKQQRLEQ